MHKQSVDNMACVYTRDTVKTSLSDRSAMWRLTSSPASRLPQVGGGVANVVTDAGRVGAGLPAMAFTRSPKPPQTSANPTSTITSSNSSNAPAVSPVVPPRRRIISCRNQQKPSTASNTAPAPLNPANNPQNNALASNTYQPTRRGR